MALVAVEPGGEKQVRGVFHYCVGLTQNLVVRSRRVVLVGTTSGDDLVRKLVVRRVVGNLVSNP